MNLILTDTYEWLKTAREGMAGQARTFERIVICGQYTMKTR